MSPRIVHVIHSGAIGGGPRVVLDLARLVPARHAIAAPNDGPLLEDARAAGIETIELPHAGKYSFPASTPGLVKAFRSATIVHVHGQFAAFYAAPIARLVNKPALYTAHFPSFVTDTNLRTTLRNRLVETVSCVTSNRVIACSDTMREEYLRRGLVSPSHITTIYNGVSKQMTGTQPADLRAKLDVAADDQIIVGVGRFTDQKGFDILLGAMPEIVAQRKNVTLILVGDGDKRRALEEQALALGVRQIVKFTGFQRDTPAYLALADVVAVPSRYDVFPLVPLEAMMADRAVVATDLPVLREAILNDVTGVLIRSDSSSFAQALVALLCDHEYRDTLAHAGRMRAERFFNVEAMAKAYERTYSDLQGFEQ